MKALIIIEDDRHVRRLLEEVVSAHGMSAVASSTAEGAWEVFQTGEFALVVLDIELPGMDGLQLCRKLRGHRAGDDTVILVVTRRTGPDALEAVLEAGADDFLGKPFTPDELAVRLIIARRRAEQRALNGGARRLLSDSRAEIDAMIESVPVGLLVLDPAGVVTEVRTGQWAHQLGVSPARVGTAATELFGEVPALRAAPDGGPTSVRARIGGRAVALRVVPLPNERGSLLVMTEATVSETADHPAASGEDFGGMVGESPVMRQLYREIRDVSAGNWTVLIEGETGAGKELVARAIHGSSPRARGPFVALNCAGLSATLLQSQLFGHRRGAFTGAVNDHVGVFEAASGGTLLLDEIGDISAEVQMSLLRVLEERRIWRLGDRDSIPVDVRVLAATHRDLPECVAAGTFRADLLYRIRVARVHVPPLRERGADVERLARAFAEQAASASDRAPKPPSDTAMAAIRAYAWPGNVRELRACMEYATIRAAGGPIELEHLPPEVRSDTARVVALPDSPRERLIAALESVGGNRAAAARLLGISRTTLYRKLDELDVRVD